MCITCTCYKGLSEYQTIFKLFVYLIVYVYTIEIECPNEKMWCIKDEII